MSKYQKINHGNCPTKKERMMKTPPSDVGEILEPLKKYSISITFEQELSKAKAQLLALLVSRLPEKMNQTKDETNSDWFYGHGYNAALKDTVSVLNGLFAQPTNTEDK